MGGVQSICHPFATVIFKIITEQRKGSEHAEQSTDSLPVFLFMMFLPVWFFQRDQQNVQPFFQYHVHRSVMWFLCWYVPIRFEHSWHQHLIQSTAYSCNTAGVIAFNLYIPNFGIKCPWMILKYPTWVLYFRLVLQYRSNHWFR